jgi:heat shock protein HtpX
MVDVARQTNSGPFCSGPSYPDGKCATKNAPAAKANGQVAQSAKPDSGKLFASADAGPAHDSGPPSIPMLMPLLMLGFIGLALFKPKLLRSLFGVVEPLKIDRRRSDAVEAPAEAGPGRTAPKWNAGPPPIPPAFGRRNA